MEAITPAEDAILSDIVHIWDAFLNLPKEHPDDVSDFRRGIHDLQRIILARPARRRWNAK